jgi:hypothetical protein
MDDDRLTRNEIGLRTDNVAQPDLGMSGVRIAGRSAAPYGFPRNPQHRSVRIGRA